MPNEVHIVRCLLEQEPFEVPENSDRPFTPFRQTSLPLYDMKKIWFEKKSIEPVFNKGLFWQFRVITRDGGYFSWDYVDITDLSEIDYSPYLFSATHMQRLELWFRNMSFSTIKNFNPKFFIHSIHGR